MNTIEGFLRRFSPTCLTLFAGLFVSIQAHADDHSLYEKSAQKVVDAYFQLSDETIFDRWVKDQWLFYAHHCASKAGISDSEKLSHAKVRSSGTWSLPRDSVSVCNALSSGPDPLCGSMSITQPPFVMPPRGGNSNYSYLEKNISGKTDVTAGGYCELVKGNRNTRQYFVGKGTVEWLQEPRYISFMSLKGSNDAYSGTMLLKISGLPDKPINVIIKK